MQPDPAALPDYAAVLEPGGGAFRLGIRFDGGRLCHIDLLPTDALVNVIADDPVLTDRVVTQLRDYFADPRKGFSVPLALRGTPFQRRVWRALMTIPPGEVRTYGLLARHLGTSARAIGGACRANPVPVIVPCHRVVASRGLGGYAGHTGGDVLAIKDWLLEHESHLAQRPH